MLGVETRQPMDSWRFGLTDSASPTWELGVKQRTSCSNVRISGHATGPQSLQVSPVALGTEASHAFIPVAKPVDGPSILGLAHCWKCNPYATFPPRFPKSGWPEPSIQGPFFEWFMKFQDTLISRLHRRYYTSANKVLRGSEADRKLDIFLTPADAALPDGEHDWSNVLVIGEHKQNPEEDRSPKH
jgi:hypothetical protein